MATIIAAHTLILALSISIASIFALISAGYFYATKRDAALREEGLWYIAESRWLAAPPTGTNLASPIPALALVRGKIGPIRSRQLAANALLMRSNLALTLPYPWYIKSLQIEPCRVSEAFEDAITMALVEIQLTMQLDEIGRGLVRARVHKTRQACQDEIIAGWKLTA